MRAVYVLVLANVIAYAMGLQWPGHPLLYGFSHANLLHLMFNLLGLLTFGLGVEKYYGKFGLVTLYLLAILCGWVWQQPDAGNMVGASAGIYALLTVYAYVKRDAPVMFLVFPMKAWVLVAFLAALEVLMIFTGWLPGISHWAHLGGIMTGVGWLIGREWKSHE